MQRRQNSKKIWKQESERTGEKFGFVYLSSVFFFISGFVCAKAGFGRTSCGGKITAFPDTGTPFALAVVSEGPACGTFAGGAAKIADCGVGGMGVPGGGVKFSIGPPGPGVLPVATGGIGVAPGIIGGVVMLGFGGGMAKGGVAPGGNGGNPAGGPVGGNGGAPGAPGAKGGCD